MDDDPMAQLQGHTITYRIAVGQQAGRKVFTVQTLPANDKTNDDRVGKMAGFSLHAGVVAGADERDKLERLCRYISRPALSEKRLKRVFNIDQNAAQSRPVGNVAVQSESLHVLKTRW